MGEETAAELSPRKKAFVAAVLTAPTVEEAARAVGVSDRTGRRYMADADVRRALSEALDGVMAEVSAKAVGAMSEALEALRAITKDKTVPPAARVSAARAILGTGTGLYELTDLEARLAALEDDLERDR